MSRMILRLSLSGIALACIMAFPGCAASRPHGCGCGMEEHMGQR